MDPLYDTIGLNYADLRRPDRRIARRINAALGDAKTVLNVGAGTGSYEPEGRTVTALEPSAAMNAQRPASSTTVMQGRAEDLPFDKLRFALNRAPKFTDLSGKSRVKRMAEIIGISIDLQLPDGGKPITQSCDHGLPLATSNAKNPLRKEIAKLARSLHDLGANEAEAAA